MRGRATAPLALLALLTGAPPAEGQGLAASGKAIAITHVNVVDVVHGTVRRDETVVVRGTRIEAVGPAARTAVPRGAMEVDGRGRFLIPGLWDMHVHTVMPGGAAALALYPASGVTGIRDMAGEWGQVVRWRGEIMRGERWGPRIVAAGPYIEGGDVPIPHILARTPGEARAAVDSLVALGVDFVKLHSQLSRDVFLAAGARARERGIPFTGHVPRSVGAAEASDSGQRSLEHLLQIPNSCTPAESLALAPRFAVQSVMGRCTSESLAPLWARFVRNGTWIVPTLVAQFEVAHWPERDLPGDAYAGYLPDSLRRYVGEIFPMPDSIPPGANAVGEALFAKRVAVVGAMASAGVAVMAGTDAPLRNSPPGFGLHAELALFVRSGMSHAAVLRSATLEPARFLGMLDSAGTVEAGKVADLVLLDADPLRDIRNARRVRAVVANGRLLGARERSALLRAAQAQPPARRGS